MKGRFVKWLTLIMSLLLLFSTLVACQQQTTTTPPGESQRSQGGEEAKEPSEGDSPSLTVKASEYEPTSNKEKVLTLTWGTWPKPPEYQGNPFTQGGVGMAGQYVFEPLLQFTRSTDKVHNRLATFLDHKENETTITLRNDVTWNDGEKFTADDVLAALYLNPRTICNYISKAEKIDDGSAYCSG
jgi:peptide/nickel transport system substrate-binding protein